MRAIAIGKSHETWVREGIERYSQRLRGAWGIEWTLLPHSRFDELQARQDESERILSRIHPGDFVILLDERGAQVSSPALSRKLSGLQADGKPVVFVIGGAYGVSQLLTDRADFVWSLSELVFPHQLVRLVLAEQLYRAQAIATGHPYHHE